MPPKENVITVVLVFEICPDCMRSFLSLSNNSEYMLAPEGSD